MGPEGHTCPGHSQSQCVARCSCRETGHSEGATAYTPHGLPSPSLLLPRSPCSFLPSGPPSLSLMPTSVSHTSQVQPSEPPCPRGPHRAQDSLQVFYPVVLSWVHEMGVSSSPPPDPHIPFKCLFSGYREEFFTLYKYVTH